MLLGSCKLLHLTSTSLGKVLQKFSSHANCSTFAQKKARYGSLFPDRLLHKKQKTPQAFYLASEDGAQLIMKALEPHLQDVKYDTLFEINPGIGLVSRRFLGKDKIFRKFIFAENIEYFMLGLLEIVAFYGDKINLVYGDVINLWKLNFQDKQDNGTRVADILKEVPRKEYDDEPNMLLFGAVGEYNFFKHLINSLVFQNSLLGAGRPEMFLIIPPPIYIHLTCNRDIGYMIYRSTSMLFQMMFEYRFLTAVPREYFLPAQADYNAIKGSKLSRVTSISPDYLYLVKIVPRRNFLEMCSPADLPALWYFVKQNCNSRRNRVIPNFEKLIPGCGTRLIINKETPEPVHQLYPDEDLMKLPQFSQPCTTMSCRDFHPGINIYTQFGDLNASQMLTLFTQFRNWPEYGESSFLASLESSLLKMETAADDTIDGHSIVDEDDEMTKTVAQLAETIAKLEKEQQEEAEKEAKAKTEEKVKKKKETATN